MAKNDQYGERHDLDEVLQQAQSEEPTQSTGQYQSVPVPVSSDSEYLQQLNSYLDKQTAILDRVEQLEAFVESQEERKRMWDDRYAKYIRNLTEAGKSFSDSVDTLWQIGKNTDEMLDEVKEIKKDGVELSAASKKILQGLGESISTELDRFLPMKFREFANSMGEAAKKSVGNLSAATTEVKTTVDDFKTWVKKVKWMFVGTVGWGILATTFCIVAIDRCSSAVRDTDEARRKFDAVEPHMRRMENDQKILMRFKKDNPRTWDKWWEQHKDEYD